jgi:hypothetical protein
MALKGFGRARFERSQFSDRLSYFHTLDFSAYLFLPHDVRLLGRSMGFFQIGAASNVVLAHEVFCSMSNWLGALDFPCHLLCS